jgi:hypothetical protein
MDGSFLDPGCLDPGRRQDIPMAAAVQQLTMVPQKKILTGEPNHDTN